MLLSSLVVLALASLATASRVPVRVRPIVHESRRSAPRGWTPIRRAEHDVRLPLRIGLVQSNLDRLDAYLTDVAHPDSPNYSQHWTHAEVAAAFRPSDESVDAVRNWLVNDGEINPSRITLATNGGWITLNATVEEAERLLGTEYFFYEHTDGTTHLACKDAYHLPEHISKHVDLVTPTLHFAVKAKANARVDHSIVGLAEGKVEIDVSERGLFPPLSPESCECSRTSSIICRIAMKS